MKHRLRFVAFSFEIFIGGFNGHPVKKLAKWEIDNMIFEQKRDDLKTMVYSTTRKPRVFLVTVVALGSLLAHCVSTVAILWTLRWYCGGYCCHCGGVTVVLSHYGGTESPCLEKKRKILEKPPIQRPRLSALASSPRVSVRKSYCQFSIMLTSSLDVRWIRR